MEQLVEQEELSQEEKELHYWAAEAKLQRFGWQLVNLGEAFKYASGLTTDNAVKTEQALLEAYPKLEEFKEFLTKIFSPRLF